MTIPHDEQEVLTDAMIDTELAKVREANAANIARLASKGIGADRIAVLFTRLEVLIDAAFTGVERAKFEISFERRLAQVLSEVEAHVTKSQLLQGVPGVDPTAPPPTNQALLRP